MRRRNYLKNKKILKKDIKIFEKEIKFRNSILSPIAEVFLESAKSDLIKLNDNYRKLS